MKNKEKYDLKELRVKWADRESVEIYADGGVYRINSNSNAVLLRGLVNWLEDEYKAPILDEKEKEYLSAVIRPWRDKVKSIGKYEYLTQDHRYIPELQYITIFLNNEEEEVNLPNFAQNTMYKGMELGREYSIEDLGL